MGKDSADLFFRSFPREAIVGSRDVEGRDVHPSISFVRHFLYRLRPSQQRIFFFFMQQQQQLSDYSTSRRG